LDNLNSLIIRTTNISSLKWLSDCCFMLYHGGQFYWWRNRVLENHRPATSHLQTLSHNVVLSTEYLKTTDLPQVTDKLYHIMLYCEYTSPWVGLKLTTLVVIDSYKSNYHIITTMTTPCRNMIFFNYLIVCYEKLHFVCGRKLY
jgi:hypothetical protein